MGTSWGTFANFAHSLEHRSSQQGIKRRWLCFLQKISPIFWSQQDSWTLFTDTLKNCESMPEVSRMKNGQLKLNVSEMSCTVTQLFTGKSKVDYDRLRWNRSKLTHKFCKQKPYHWCQDEDQGSHEEQEFVKAFDTVRDCSHELRLLTEFPLYQMHQTESWQFSLAHWIVEQLTFARSSCFSHSPISY